MAVYSYFVLEIQEIAEAAIHELAICGLGVKAWRKKLGIVHCSFTLGNQWAEIDIPDELFRSRDLPEFIKTRALYLLNYIAEFGA